jgi:hypothetical protein
MPLVAPVLHVLAGVVVRPALAVVVDRLAVGKHRSAIPVDAREAIEGQVVEHHADEIVGVRRAGGQVDQVLRLRHCVGHAQGSGGIGSRGRQAAESSTGADGNGRGRPTTHLAGDVDGRAATDRAVRTVSTGRNRPLHDRDIGARFLLDDLGQDLVCLVPGGRHDSFVVFHREDVQDDVPHRRSAGAQERLGVASAILELQPDQGGLLLGLDGLGDRRPRRFRQGECGGHHPTKPEEIPTRHTASL